MKQRFRKGFEHKDVRGFVEDIFDNDIHSKRITSLAGATTGVLASGSLAISAIGLGLSHVCGTTTKHAVKQVDRLVGNDKVDVWAYFRYWVPHVVSGRQNIMVAMDWTDFDRDGHATIALNLLTEHGRAIPLIWRTVQKSKLKNNRNEFEDSILLRLHETLPQGIKVTIVADRGFMDVALFEGLRDELNFGYIIRLRGNIKVSAANGEKRTAAQWVGKGGRARTLRKAKLTAKEFPVPTVVCVQAKEMKESWCLAASDPNVKSAELTKYYGKRWGIETYFRDTKDIRFGLGMDAIHTKSTKRRDRLFLLSAMAIVLLTLLGAACESIGYDRYLKANTVKRRTHSLFRQGQMIYELIPRMKEEWLTKIMSAFAEKIQEHRALSEIFSVV
ncbi:MAG: IS4 family transposase [Gammaproteobacteria bacterium]|nr:IS4 family transposase [Gammaproteobacteria bacterium]